MGVRHQLELTELEEVGERLVKTCPWMTFQNEVDIQVVGSKHLAVLSNRPGAKGHLLLRQVAFDLSLAPVHHENSGWPAPCCLPVIIFAVAVAVAGNGHYRGSPAHSLAVVSGSGPRVAGRPVDTDHTGACVPAKILDGRGLAAAAHSLADDQPEGPQVQFCQVMIVIKQNVRVSSHRNRNPHCAASCNSLSDP